MSKKQIAKVVLSLGIATSLTICCGATFAGSNTETICQETQMAGICLSLDKFYEENFQDGELVNPITTPTAQATTGAAVTPQTPAEADTSATAQTPVASTEPTVAPSTPKPTPKVSKQFQVTALSIASDYVNIRKKPNTDSKILGKLYEGSSCKILGETKGWTKIESGSVQGYIKSEYLAKGAKAQALASKYGTFYASVKPGTITLNVRMKPNTSCKILTQIPEDETYRVIKEGNSWVKISVDGDVGYVAKEFVNLKARFKKAVSIEEELAEQKRIEEAERAEQERLAALEEEKRQQQQASSRTQQKSSSNSTKTSSSSKKSTNSTTTSSSSKKSSSSSSTTTAANGSGQAIAEYAQKFVGNRYVYGGSSLTKGTDCSGFTMRIYEQFGYSLPHSSRAQANCGRKVSLSSVQPGDLIFYKNGSRIGHVALYIGGGRVCHASNPSDGIKISNMRYRTPCCARRIIG